MRIMQPKSIKPKQTTPNVYRKKHWSETTVRNSSTIFRAPREFGDNDPASPEQNWEVGD